MAVFHDIQRPAACAARAAFGGGGAEKGAGGHLYGVFFLAGDEFGFNAPGVAQGRPVGAGAGEFQDDADALLLHAQGGDFGEVAGFHAGHARFAARHSKRVSRCSSGHEMTISSR